MKNLADFLKVPESLDKFDYDNYMLGLIFANRSFFKFEVIDDDLKVCEKDSGKEVFYKKNYFMSNEINEYQKKSLVCDDEFELDLPLKANISDMMYIVDIDWEYSNEYKIIGVSDIQVHNVRVTEISGSSDTNILLTSENLTGEKFFLPQQLYFYTEDEANSYIDKLIASGSACHHFYQTYEKDLESMQYYKYRVRSPYKFNQVLTPIDLRALCVSCNTSMICERFIFDATDFKSSGTTRHSGTIQFRGKFFDDENNLFVDVPSDELVYYDTSNNKLDLHTFVYQGKKLSRLCTSANVDFDTVFSIVRVKED